MDPDHNEGEMVIETTKPPTKTFHWSHLEGSKPLRRMLRLLCDGRSHSTREIGREADICAVSTAASELRHNGIAVEDAEPAHPIYPNTGEESPKIYYYYRIKEENIRVARERLAEAEEIARKKMLDTQTQKP